mmetsp:Transcript_27544/g.74961  ORF Transcript_27544/g.74961 Transcript_27544/m.74961 type:complete len:204 (+) Transcript_27544:1196-1807(+)
MGRDWDAQVEILVVPGQVRADVFGRGRVPLSAGADCHLQLRERRMAAEADVGMRHAGKRMHFDADLAGRSTKILKVATLDPFLPQRLTPPHALADLLEAAHAVEPRALHRHRAPRGGAGGDVGVGSVHGRFRGRPEAERHDHVTLLVAAVTLITVITLGLLVTCRCIRRVALCVGLGFAGGDSATWRRCALGRSERRPSGDRV